MCVLVIHHFHHHQLLFFSLHTSKMYPNTSSVVDIITDLFWFTIFKIFFSITRRKNWGNERALCGKNLSRFPPTLKISRITLQGILKMIDLNSCCRGEIWSGVPLRFTANNPGCINVNAFYCYSREGEEILEFPKDECKPLSTLIPPAVQE